MMMTEMVRKFRAYRIRKRLYKSMSELRGLRRNLEKVSDNAQSYLLRYGPTAPDTRFATEIVTASNRLADAFDHLRPYSPPQTLMEAIHEIQEMAKLEQVFVAKGLGLRKDPVAQR
jgi:hypothetical protein